MFSGLAADMKDILIHPAFVDGIARINDCCTRRCTKPPDQEVEIIDSEFDGLRMSVAIDGDTATWAGFAGTDHPGESAVLKLVCRYAIGAPLRDIAEHAVSQALETLLDRNQPRPVAGILTPHNAGAMFARPSRLLRHLWQTYREAHGVIATENEFDRPFSDTWKALDQTTKLDRISDILAENAKLVGLDLGDLVISRIDTYDRVFLFFSERITQKQQPSLLMDLEQKVRANLGERVELFVEEAKDANRIRRL